MSVFTLDKLREAVDAKYQPTVLDAGDTEYILPNPLRMDEKKREKVQSLLNKVNEASEGDDENADTMIDLFREIINVAEKNDKGDKLNQLLDEDVLVIEFIQSWMEGSQVGEA